MQLGNGEHIIYHIKKHWMYILTPFWITSFFRYLIEEIVLTNRQFYMRTGILSKTVTSIPLKKINNVSYKQGIIGRIFGYGTLYLQSAAEYGGLGHSFISNPEKVKTMIEQAIDAKESK